MNEFSGDCIYDIFSNFQARILWCERGQSRGFRNATFKKSNKKHNYFIQCFFIFIISFQKKSSLSLFFFFLSSPLNIIRIYNSLIIMFIIIVFFLAYFSAFFPSRLVIQPFIITYNIVFWLLHCFFLILFFAFAFCLNPCFYLFPKHVVADAYNKYHPFCTVVPLTFYYFLFLNDTVQSNHDE